MSGILGCWNIDGAPVDRPLLERMMRRLAHRGPDGSGLWANGAIGLGHLAFHTTPEAVHERQPLADAGGELQLTLDGRVDNRAELLADLRANGCEPREDTDAELVLQAYRCWGEECPARIVGDFAFAVWDRPAQRLFCARDAPGARQLFYYRDARVFLWATEWRALFEHAAVSRAPNEQVLAQYLSNTFASDDDTLFRDVARLPAAHSLTLTRAGLRLRRYWSVDLRRAIRYRDDGDYAAHFRSVFREAVRCRLRSQAPVAADLSGGLDSSSIVAMAQALRAEGAMGAPDFRVCSLTFPGRACDERPFVEAVTRRWKLVPHYCEGATADRGYFEAQARRDFVMPLGPSGVLSENMRRMQGAAGARVVLDGHGGDEWFTGGDHRFADLLREGRLAALAKEVLAGRRQTGDPHSLKELLRTALWPLLPLGLRVALRRLLGRLGSAPFIAPAFARQLPSIATLCQEPVLGAALSFDQAGMRGCLRGNACPHGWEGIHPSAARQGVEGRSPFMDRRLIEFAFALPAEQRRRGSWTKFVMREAMRGLLPESVAARTDKAEFSHAIVETLCAPGMNFGVGESTLESLGWVDGASVRQAYREMIARYNAADPSYSRHAWALWCLFGTEIWMNEVVLRA
jgi:asparagine synthase (glutamine-hydrolysing)